MQAAADAICTSDALVRKISVVYNTPGSPLPCQVVYEKPDQNQYMTLWRAQNQEGFCEQQAARFATKLDALGWDCTDASAEDPGVVEQEADLESAPAESPRVRKTFLPATSGE